jgi:hypothetical protein
MEIKKENMDKINEIDVKMLDLQSEEMIEEAMDLAAMNSVRKNKEYLNKRCKLITKRNKHDNEYIKNANNLIDRL